MNGLKNNIKQILEKKNMSILKLSKAIGLSYNATYDLVHRKNLDTTTLKTLDKVANVLGVDIKELWEKQKD